MGLFKGPGVGLGKFFAGGMFKSQGGGGGPVLVPDRYFDSAIALLNFDGNIADQRGNTWTAVGNVAYEPGLTGNAVRISGAGSYIQLDTPEAPMKREQWTVEFWAKANAVGAGGELFRLGSNASGFTPFSYNLPGGNTTIRESYDGSGAGTEYGVGTVSVGAWVHHAIVRDHFGYRAYTGGVHRHAYGLPMHIDIGFALTTGMRLGYGGAGFDVTYDGLRVLRGVCLYPNGTTFTPPNPPSSYGNAQDSAFDPYFPQVSSLLNFDGNLTDATGKVWTAYSGAAADGAAKFGAGSLSLSGTKVIETPNNAGFSFGNGDFTIEGWFYPTAMGSAPLILDTRSANAAQAYVFGFSDSARRVQFYDGNGSRQSTNAVPLNQWSHVAVSRSSDVLRIFINGAQEYQGASPYGLDSAGTAAIGNKFYGGNPEYAYSGLIDSFRVTKGIGRYKTAFTPPTAAFQNQ